MIIRRPHAYAFLVQHFGGEGEGAPEVRGSEAGLRIGELDLAIPGFYVLDARGETLARIGLGSAQQVLDVLREHAQP